MLTLDLVLDDLIRPAVTGLAGDDLLVVCSGGVLAATGAGVPLVVAGGTLDKPEIARRVGWSGVGLDLRTGRPKPERLRQAVLRVLNDPRSRARSREISESLAAAGGASAAATLVEKLL